MTAPVKVWLGSANDGGELSSSQLRDLAADEVDVLEPVGIGSDFDDARVLPGVDGGGGVLGRVLCLDVAGRPEKSPTFLFFAICLVIDDLIGDGSGISGLSDM